MIGLTRDELASRLHAVGVPEDRLRMRAKQLWHWIYHRGAVEFGAMTTIGGALRAALAERYSLARPETVTEQRSEDGTRKWLLRFADGLEVETVYIRRRTAARSASRLRWGARFPARSATLARNAWCEI